MQNAEAQLKNLDQKFSGFTDIGSRFSDVGKKLTLGITAPVVGLGGVVAKTAIDFEEQMSKVKAISGATGDDFTKLTEKAKEMGAKTQFSAKESAEAMTYMAMAGWDTTSIIDGLGGVMDLAASSGENLGLVSDIVTDAMTAFGLSADQSSRFADVLAQTSASANTNVAMLGESFKYVAPVAGALGYSVEDTSIALGLMANSGIKGSQAGTALRASLSRMIKPTDDMADVMNEYGISLTNSDGSMKTLAEVMDMLRGKLGGLDEATQAQVASTLFGQEAMSGMLAIVNTSEEDYAKLTDSVNGSAGAAADMAAVMQDNLAGKFKQLSSAVEGIAIQLGNILIPIITEVVGFIKEWVDKFAALDEGTQKTILTIAGIAAAVGPAIAIFGKLITTVGKVQRGFNLAKDMTTALMNSQIVAAAKTKIMAAAQAALNAVMSANPITLVVIGIAALVAAFVVLWNKCEGFREFWIGLWEKIKEVAGDVWDWFKETASAVVDGVTQAWASFKEWFTGMWQSIQDFFIGLWEGIKLIFQTSVEWVLETFSGMFEGISMLWEGITQFFAGAWEVIKNIFMGALLILIDLVTLDFGQMKSDIANIWENIKNGLSNMWEGIKTAFEGWLTAIKEFWSTIWTGVWEFIKEVWNNIVNFFKELFTNLGNTISNAWQSFKTTISNKCQEIWQTIVDKFNAVINWLKELPGKLMQIGKDMFTKMKDGVVSTVTGVYTAVVNGVTKAIDWLKALPKQALTWGKHMIEGFIDGVLGSVGKLVDTVKGVGNKIRDFLGFSIPKKGPLHVYMEWMPHMIQGMSASLEDEAPLLYRTAQDVAGGLSDNMTNTSASVTTPVDYSSAFSELAQKISDLADVVTNAPEAVFNINGREFARATASDISKVLADRTR